MRNDRRGFARQAKLHSKLLFAALAAVLILTPACTKVQSGADWRNTGILRVGVVDEPDSLNPLFSHTAVADDAAALLFAPLFRYDARGEYVPELAARVPSRAGGDIAKDGRTIVLRLRRGLRWSDGAPLTARDVRFTWQAVNDPRNAVKLRAGWSAITAIDTPDAYTAVVHLKKSDATVLALFAGGGDAAYPPLPEHLLAHEHDLNHAEFNAHPLSSGPWLLARWEHGDTLAFTPNPRYRLGAPRLRGIRLRILADSQTLVTALRAHEIDAVMNVPTDALPLLRPLPGLRLQTHAVAAYRHLDLNCRDAILRDVRVRRAIIAAIDWRRLLHAVYHDDALEAETDIFPSSWAAPHVPPYLYDVALAGRLLDAAGWTMQPDGVRARAGRPLSLTLMGGNANAVSLRAQTLMASDLAHLGVRVAVKNAPASYLFAEDGPLYGGRYQMAWMSDTRAPDPDNRASWSSDARPPDGGNTVFLADPVVDEAARRAVETSVRAQRRALYQREELRLHELAPARIFAWQRETVAVWGTLRGFIPATYYSSFGNSWAWHS